ncbi:MAG TPA: hypothetical protein VMW08_00270 [Acidimicrobiales bacterium]|nr:hypothetical protein [Acidimicrobiales bacterium]
MTDPTTSRTLQFGLTCHACGEPLVFLGAGHGTGDGTMRRARVWCVDCDNGFVLTLTMRAMSPTERAVQKGEEVPELAPRLRPHEGDGELGREPVDRTGPRAGARALRSSAPVDLPAGDHGTRYAYERHGCRCDPCTDEQTASKRRYLERKSA